MSTSKNLLLFIVTAITLADLKLTVGREISTRVKNICFTSVIICLFSLSSCVDKTKEENKSTVTDAAPETKNELEGAWELVWSKTGDKVSELKKPLQIKLFTDGYFCLIMHDSIGKWNIASGGTYETDGNVYKETHLYVTDPEWVGGSDWQQYEIKGDTLYKKLFTKVVNSKGEDITAQFPSNIEEKRVRAKR
jgi:hypothetical protein